MVLRARRSERPRRQRGFAMIAIVTLVAMMGAYFIANALTKTQAGLASERESRTQLSLAEAKRALIAWAASESAQRGTSGTFQPGALPCPAKDDPANPSNDGNAQGSCSSASTRLGRLPWKTINTSDLRDANGERLWYAVSSNFVKSSSSIINSDTQGQLSVSGAAPATSVVAVILAPGITLQQSTNVQGAVQDQNRTQTSYSAINDPSNYFEGANASTNDDAFTVATVDSSIANDRLAVVTLADLMDAVEPLVAASLTSRGLGSGAASSIKELIASYVSDWGKYPFAASFSNPGTSSYQGTAGLEYGLLPVTTASGFVAWNNPSTTATVAKTGGSGTVTVVGCSASTTSLLDCQLSYVNSSGDATGPVVDVTATVSNAALAFLSKNSSTDLTVWRFSSGSWNVNTTTIQSVASGCLGTVVPVSSETYCFQSTNSLYSSGNGQAVIRIQFTRRTSTRTIRLRIAPPSYSPLPSATSTTADAYWFMHNQWYKQIHYAVSPAYLPGGTAPCSGNCLTVSGFWSGSQTNVQALLVLAGRSINGSSRPSSNLSDYLEGQNATPSDRIYETRIGPPGSINDRAAVIAP